MKKFFLVLCLFLCFGISGCGGSDDEKEKNYSDDPLETMKEDGFEFEYSEGNKKDGTDGYIYLDIKGYVEDDYLMISIMHDYTKLVMIDYSRFDKYSDGKYITEIVYNNDKQNTNKEARDDFEKYLKVINIQFDDFINQMSSINKNYKELAKKSIPASLDKSTNSSSLLDTYGRSAIQENCKQWISKILKSPSTAKYPGSFLNPDKDWQYDEKDGIITVKSYVDSQNSFGTEVRGDFVIKMEIQDDIASCTYLSLDGTVYTNKYD